jgi:hypothetical protein
MYYVLRSLLQAGALAVGDEADTVRVGLYGLLSTQALQVVALLAGSVLAGAGQRSGGIYGSMVGVWNGILCTMIQGLQGEPVTAVNLYGQPILHTAFGAFGGMLGGWLWRPIPVNALPVRPVPRHPSDSALFQLTHAHIHWLRVLGGVGIAAAGYVWADTILQIVLASSEGRLTLRTSIQQMVLTLEITALGVFIGGAFAGATTWHGSAQGAWVGLLGSALYLGYQVGYLHVYNWMTLGLMAGGILALSFLGGSFGCRLLPAVLRPRKSLGLSAV